MKSETNFQTTLDKYIDELIVKALQYCKKYNYKFSFEPYVARNTWEITISVYGDEEHESYYQYFYLNDFDAIKRLESLMETPILLEPKKEVA